MTSKIWFDIFDALAENHPVVVAGGAFSAFAKSDIIPRGLKMEIARTVETGRQHERQLSFLMDYLGISREDLENKCRELDIPLPVLYDKILAGWYIVGDKLNEPTNNGVARFGLAID